MGGGFSRMFSNFNKPLVDLTSGDRQDLAKLASRRTKRQESSVWRRASTRILELTGVVGLAYAGTLIKEPLGELIDKTIEHPIFPAVALWLGQSILYNVAKEVKGAKENAENDFEKAVISGFVRIVNGTRIATMGAGVFYIHTLIYSNPHVISLLTKFENAEFWNDPRFADPNALHFPEAMTAIVILTTLWSIGIMKSPNWRALVSNMSFSLLDKQSLLCAKGFYCAMKHKIKERLGLISRGPSKIESSYKYKFALTEVKNLLKNGVEGLDNTEELRDLYDLWKELEQGIKAVKNVYLRYMDVVANNGKQNRVLKLGEALIEEEKRVKALMRDFAKRLANEYGVHPDDVEKLIRDKYNF